METIGKTRRIGSHCSTEPRAAHDGSSSGITRFRKCSLRTCLILTTALVSLGFAMQAPAANQQQERMKSCNSQAKAQTLSGAERQDFMKRCLSGQDAAASEKGLNSQQRKMKSCNAEASLHGLKGTARTSFMSTCLK